MNGHGAVSKRKGNRGKTVTRNRLKVEKLRESLHCLNLEEEPVEIKRNKFSGEGPSLRVLLHDLAFPVGAHGIRVQIHNDDGCSNSQGDAKEQWKTQRGETSDVTENKITSAECDGFEFRPASLSTRSDKEEKDNKDESQTLESCTSVSIASLTETSPKRKLQGDEKQTRVKNLKGSSSRFKWETLEQFSTMSNVQFSDTHLAINNDHNSPSPSNSPLYDMPPPSTPAQKQARRAKRQLQLERWKKYDVSRSRQERYKRRNQEIAETTLSLDSRHIQWSHDLVQTVYIDDESE